MKHKRVRIEFDNVTEVPQVWIDGKRIDRVKTGGLVALHIDWNTDTDKQQHKQTEIEWNVFPNKRNFYVETFKQRTYW